jgi:ribosomal protein S18 acetylase RimI-like enzyme
MELRRPTAADVETCLAVQRAAAVVGYVHIFDQATHPFPDDVVRGEWVERLGSDAVVLIGSVDGQPVGVIGVRGKRVEGLFVVPEQWGSGLAQQLHDEAVTRIAAGGHDSAVLHVLVDNARARRFYERNGWAADGDPSPSPWPPYPEQIAYRRVIAAS